jgi:esterase/lipase
VKTLERIDQAVWELRERVRQSPGDLTLRRDLLRFFHESVLYIERRAGVPERDRSFLLLQQREALGVLLLHGAGGTPDEMRSLGDYLYSLGFTAYGIRLPIDPRSSDSGFADYARRMIRRRGGDGAQHSAAPGCGSGGWSGCLARAEVTLSTMLAYSADTYTAGFSFGGTIALNLMRSHPVRGTILLSPALFPGGGTRHAIFRAALRILPRLTRRIMPVRSTMLDLIMMTRTAIGDDIREPILMVQAADDPVLSARGYQFLQKRSRNAASRFVLLPSGGHVIVRGDQSREVFRICGDFIKGI